MKKIFSLLLFVTLLVGCSSADSSDSVDNTGKTSLKTEGARVIEPESPESTKKTDPNLVTDGPLLEVGQYLNDDIYGKIELEKIASPGNQVEIAPNIFVTFGDIKITNFVDIPKSAQEDANLWYGFNGNQGYGLQFEYTVENKNDFKIDNAAVEQVILSDGEQIERFMYNEEAFQLEAGSKASDQIGHVAIPHSDISSVKFYINPVNYDTYDSLGSQPIEVIFD